MRNYFKHFTHLLSVYRRLKKGLEICGKTLAVFKFVPFIYHVKKNLVDTARSLLGGLRSWTHAPSTGFEILVSRIPSSLPWVCTWDMLTLRKYTISPATFNVNTFHTVIMTNGLKAWLRHVGREIRIYFKWMCLLRGLWLAVLSPCAAVFIVFV